MLSKYSLCISVAASDHWRTKSLLNCFSKIRNQGIFLELFKNFPDERIAIMAKLFTEISNGKVLFKVILPLFRRQK